MHRSYPMRPRNVLAFSISLVLAAPSWPSHPDSHPRQLRSQRQGTRLQCGQYCNGPPSIPKARPASKSRSCGDHARGVRRVLQTSGGVRDSIHTHTHAMRSCSSRHVHSSAEGKTEVRLGPVRLMQPAGTPAHDLLRQGAECVFRRKNDSSTSSRWRSNVSGCEPSR